MPDTPSDPGPSPACATPFFDDRERPKPTDQWLQISSSRDFPEWLAAQNASIAFTTYEAGKLIMIGTGANGRLTISERTFTRCMGLWADETEGRTLWVSSLYQIWRMENALLPGQQYNHHDRLYVPREGRTTGNLDVHDIAQDSSGRLVFINTLFSCVATFSKSFSFAPVWQPPFISKLAPEDRCHLNGLALEDGQPAYVTACSTSDTPDGWRAQRGDGGCLIDIRTNETLLSGLSMPHSPRVHNGEIYLHNSGVGCFGRFDQSTRAFVPICSCPGYLRGLAFFGDHAVVGLSRPRDKGLKGLQLDDELAKTRTAPTCGLQVIDLASGKVVHWVKIEGVINELYEVVVLPTVRQPTLLGFKTDEIHQIITMDQTASL